MDANSGKSKGFKRGANLALWTLVLVGVGLALSGSGARSLSASHREIQTVLPASIRPHNMATLTSAFPGKIGEVYVSQGAHVEVGDTLMNLVNPEFELEYERAKLRYADLQELVMSRSKRAGGSQSEPDAQALVAAQDRLAGFSVNEAETAYKSAAARLSEMEKLVQANLATDTELEQAKRTEENELRNLRSEREHLSRLREEVAVLQARIENARNASSSAEELNFKVQLREAEAAFRIAKARLESQKLVATVSGTVLRTMVNAGDQIPSGVPLLQIGQLDQLDFDVPVGANLAKRFKVGEMVSVRIPTEPPVKAPAPISAIVLVPAQDQSAYTVRITMKNPSPSAVLVGLSAEVEFPHSEAEWHAFRF